jgi:uncharacterized protein (TIGR03067 family)
MNASLLILALAVAAPGLKDKPPPGIEGEWAIESRIVDGQPDAAAKTDHIKVADGRWTILQPDGRKLEWVLDLDPAAKPPTLTLFQADNPARKGPAEMSGIYKVDGDTLTICYVFEGARPTEFGSVAGSKARLMTLRRVKDR